MAGKDIHNQSEKRETAPRDSLDELHRLARSQIIRLDPYRTRRRLVYVTGLVLVCVLFLVIWFLLNPDKFQTGARTEMDDQNVNDVTAVEIDTLITEIEPTIDESVTAGGASPPQASLTNDQFLLFFPVISNELPLCVQLDEIHLELLSGPELDPPEGTIDRSKITPKARASWKIRNLSNCQWDHLSLYSIYNGSTLRPEIHRQAFDLVPSESRSGIYPGDVLEISATFAGDDAEKINEEWILVINGHQLFSEPHLNLNVRKWLVWQKPPSGNQAGDQTGGNPGRPGDSTSPGDVLPVRPTPNTAPTRPPPDAPVRP